jgi:hypothetical protein
VTYHSLVSIMSLDYAPRFIVNARHWRLTLKTRMGKQLSNKYRIIWHSTDVTIIYSSALESLGLTTHRPKGHSTFFLNQENEMLTTLLLKNTLLVGNSLVDCTQELQAKCTSPHGSPPWTTMLSRKNSRWCLLVTVIAPGSPKSESTKNSAV